MTCVTLKRRIEKCIKEERGWKGRGGEFEAVQKEIKA